MLKELSTQNPIFSNDTSLRNEGKITILSDEGKLRDLVTNRLFSKEWLREDSKQDGKYKSRNIHETSKGFKVIISKTGGP